MKLVVRAMGSFLVAALAAVLVIATTCYTLIPELSQYISNTFPSETNIEFVSSVAADPNPTRSEPTDGEAYETKDYVYTYSSTEEGWSVSVKNKGKARYESLNGKIYSKPLINVSETFKGCTALVQAPAIPSGVKKMTSVFDGCTALTGLVAVYAEPEQYDDCFKGTTQPISLIGGSTMLSALTSTSNGNVSVE